MICETCGKTFQRQEIVKKHITFFDVRFNMFGNISPARQKVCFLLIENDRKDDDDDVIAAVDKVEHSVESVPAALLITISRLEPNFRHISSKSSLRP